MKITLRFQTEDRQGDLSVALLPTKLFPFRNGLDRCYLWICRSHLVIFQCEMLIIDIILSFPKCVIKNLQHPIIFALCAFQQQIKLPSNWNTTPHRVRHVCSTFTHLSAPWRNTCGSSDHVIYTAAPFNDVMSMSIYILKQSITQVMTSQKVFCRFTADLKAS